MITLAIEASSNSAAVAVLQDDAIVFSERFIAERRHSSLLFPVLQRALLTAPAPDRVVIGLGPGSYSGVRVAISAAIGLRLAVGARLLGLNSLLALETDESEYAVIGDARRRSFHYSEIRERQLVKGPLIFDAGDAPPFAPDLPLFTTEPLPDFPEAQRRNPSAEILARLAAEEHCILQRDQLEPLYLRDPHITTSIKERIR